MTAADWAVLAAYFVSLLAIGAWAGRTEKDADDFFLGGRRMPWLPVCISIIASATSALTFIGIPGTAFGGDFTYLQLAVGDITARVVIAGILITAYYRAGVKTVYELLGVRFGPWTRLTGTLFFLVTRVLASSVRLAGCAIAVSVFFGLGLQASIVVVSAVAAAYTVSGGIKAVIWTDVLQFTLFVGSAAAALAFALAALPGGWSEFVAAGQAAGKFTVLKLGTGWNDPNGFVAGSFFGFMLTFAVFGTDQDMVQRMLTCPDAARSRRAVVLSGLLTAPMNALFLLVGAALFAYYQAHPDPAVAALSAAGKNDYVFPHFISHVLPAGMRGLLVAGLLAVAMGSLDSASNALAQAAYVDIVKPYFPRLAGMDSLKVSRWLVAVFIVILAAVAVLFGHQPSILWFGLQIMGYTFGALLGVFLLAVLTERGRDVPNVLAMLTSVPVVVWLTGPGRIAWPWAVTLGTAWTLAWGAAFSTRSR